MINGKIIKFNDNDNDNNIEINIMGESWSGLVCLEYNINQVLELYDSTKVYSCDISIIDKHIYMREMLLCIGSFLNSINIGVLNLDVMVLSYLNLREDFNLQFMEKLNSLTLYDLTWKKLHDLNVNWGRVNNSVDIILYSDEGTTSKTSYVVTSKTLQEFLLYCERCEECLGKGQAEF